MNADRHGLNEVSEKIIGSAFHVHNNLGCGFLEKVYENELVIELRKVEFKIAQQSPIKVYYEGVTVGDYIADILVEDEIIIEVKAVKHIDEIHQAQLLNYLKATGLKLEIKRLVNRF